MSFFNLNSYAVHRSSAEIQFFRPFPWNSSTTGNSMVFYTHPDYCCINSTLKRHLIFLIYIRRKYEITVTATLPFYNNYSVHALVCVSKLFVNFKPKIIWYTTIPNGMSWGQLNSGRAFNDLNTNYYIHCPNVVVQWVHDLNSY